MSKKNAYAKLLHDAKRCYVYQYGPSQTSCDGKITISKRLFDDEEADYVEAIETGDIVIENASSTANLVNLPGKKVDETALVLIGEIVDGFFEVGSVPVTLDL